MKKIALLLGLLSVVAANCSQGLNKKDLHRELTRVNLELRTYENRAENLKLRTSQSEAAETVRFYESILLELEVSQSPRIAERQYRSKRFLESKKAYLAEKKAYFAQKQEEIVDAKIKLLEAYRAMSKILEVQELELIKKEIETLKEKIQQILVLLQQCKE